MTMNQTTESHKECLTSTVSSGCQNYTSNAIGKSPSYILLAAPAVSERLSTHGRKRSLFNTLKERERNDPSFRERMIEARKALAEEIHDVSPENSLAKWRLMKGLTQQGLAEILGTSQSHVAKIEAGKVNIQFDTAIKLSKSLDISLNDLQRFIENSRIEITAKAS